MELGRRKFTIRWARETPSPTGRTIVVVTDAPMAFVSAGPGDARPKAGYQVGVDRIDGRWSWSRHRYHGGGGAGQVGRRDRRADRGLCGTDAPITLTALPASRAVNDSDRRSHERWTRHRTGGFVRVATGGALLATLALGLSACGPKVRANQGRAGGSGTGTLTAARAYLEGRWSLESFEVHPAGKRSSRRRVRAL